MIALIIAASVLGYLGTGAVVSRQMVGLMVDALIHEYTQDSEYSKTCIGYYNSDYPCYHHDGDHPPMLMKKPYDFWMTMLFWLWPVALPFLLYDRMIGERTAAELKKQTGVSKKRLLTEQELKALEKECFDD